MLGQNRASDHNSNIESAEAQSSNDARLAFWQRLNEQIGRVNTGLEISSELMKENYGSAATQVGALLTPMQFLNSKLLEVNSNYKALGVTVEDVAASTQFHAAQLTSIFDRARGFILSFPNMLKQGLYRGMDMESTAISGAAGIVRSEFTNSIDEGKMIISQVKDIVRRESAPLPGDTQTHMLVAENTVDDSFRLAKLAGVEMEEAKDFAAWTAGQIGAIGGVQGANSSDTLRFANALMSGTLSAKSQLNIVERNPALKSAITDTLKEYGATQFYQISKDKQMEAMRTLLEKAFPKDQLEASANTLDGAMQGMQTGLKSLQDMTRVLEKKYDIEISVYSEMRELAMRVLLPASAVLEKFSAPDFEYDPMKLLQKGLSQLYPLLGGTAKDDSDLVDMSAKEAMGSLGGFDTLQWFNAKMNRGDEFSEVFEDPEQALRIFKSTLNSFQMGWDEAMSRFTGWLKFTEIIPTRSIANLAGEILASIVNSVARAKSSLIPVIRDFMVELFASVKENLDIASIFSFLREFHSITQLFDRLKGNIANIQKLPSLFSGMGKALITLTGLISSASFAFGILIPLLKSKPLANNMLGNVAAAPLGLVAGIQKGFGGNYQGTLNAANAVRGGIGGAQNYLVNEHDRMNAMSGQIAGLNPLSWLFPNKGKDYKNPLSPGQARIQQGLASSAGAMGKMAMILPALSAIPGISDIPVLNQIASPMGGVGAALLGGGLQLGSMSVGLAAQAGGGAEKLTSMLGKKNPLFERLSKSLGKFGEAITGILTSPGKLMAIGKALTMFMMWFTVFAGFIFAIYKQSPELQSAVKRFINGIMDLFTYLDDRLRVFFKPLERIFRAVGKVLAWILNKVSDLLGFAKVDRVDTTEVQDRLLRGQSRAQQERIDDANAAADSSYMGSAPALIYTAANGFVGNLVSAAKRESQNMPTGSNLVLANSSETIRTAEQEEALRLKMGYRGQSINIETININVHGIQSEEGPLGVGNEIARVLLTRLREASEDPR
jgi:hypothetical protein